MKKQEHILMNLRCISLRNIVTKNEIISKQNTEIEYLKAEVELLKN
ncbi:MAG: hypothetical protein RR136_04965 [Clostridia bacterium]